MSDRSRDLRLALSRRHLLKGFGAAAVTSFAMGGMRNALADPVFSIYPFQLGVASGDPAPDGFVIWTRLAPEPFEIGYGMPGQPVEVEWEVAEDERFRTIAKKGVAVARPELGHSVHVELTGLLPGRSYWYRFAAGRERSLVGRAVTTPALGAATDHVRFAVAGCQNYEQGYYTAYRKIAEEDGLDFVFCYGDYIYEGRGNRLRGTQETIRPHFGQEIYSLGDYRRRYAQYKMDTDLQAAHAATSWFAVWDDHETENNWASIHDENGTDPAIFALRRQAAAQAYYENMPLRASALPVGSAIQIFRRASYGTLLDLNLLDTRQYRTDQPCGDRQARNCTEINKPDAEMMGQRQHEWLMKGLKDSRAQWKTIAQQVMVMDLDRDPGPDVSVNLDSWAGYRAPRERMLKGMRDASVQNAVVLTGDEHQNFAGELHIDGSKPGPKPIAVEFVGTSITSGGDGRDQGRGAADMLSANQQLKFINSQRGYLLCDVTRERWLTDFKVLDKVSERGGTLTSRKKLAVLPGSATLQQA
jgi:alkaline phosphatase D